MSLSFKFAKSFKLMILKLLWILIGYIFSIGLRFRGLSLVIRAHFCNQSMEALLWMNRVMHKVSKPYHP